MYSTLKRVALGALTLLSAPFAQASFIDSVIDTFPAGYVSPAEGQSRSAKAYWDDTVRGTKAIMKDGATTWIFPAYTAHPKFHWDNEREQNAYPFGMGLGRTVVDDRGNERTLYLTTFIDSNYRMEPIVGYQWLARFPLMENGLHWGAGYVAGISARGDYKWIPFPVLLPVAKIGTDRFAVYGTYIPKLDVGFVYTTITIDDHLTRNVALPTSSAWHKKENFVYASIGREYIDNGGEEYTPHFASNGNMYALGLRHYSGRHWATDLSVRHSKHLFRSPGEEETYDFDNVSLQVQYNIDAADRLRLYAGLGIGYSRMKGSETKDHSVHPVSSIGATYAITNNLFVDAGMTVLVSRFHGGLKAAGPHYNVRSMPTDFALSVGYAF